MVNKSSSFAGFVRFRPYIRIICTPALNNLCRPMDKNLNFKTLLWIGKNLEVQARFFKNFNFPSLFWIGKNLNYELWIGKYTMHSPAKTNISKSKFWIYGWIRKSLCPKLRFTVENRAFHTKKGWSHFKLNINDWDIPFSKILKIYQCIGRNTFHWGKWNEPIGNSAHTIEYFNKRPWRYIFLTRA